MSIMVVHPGAGYHCESLENARFRHFFDAWVRPESLSERLLDAAGVLIVPCRTPAQRMQPHADLLKRFLERGRTIVAMGESQSHTWLPGVVFTPQPTNWWWWLEPGASLGLVIACPRHPLFSLVAPEDIAWHLHGSFQQPPGALSLIDDAQGRSVLYVDEVTTNGRMIVTSLDPFFHHGSHFMPATTRFLDGFLPWIRDHVAQEAPSRAQPSTRQSSS